jgi:hypothetical protein
MSGGERCSIGTLASAFMYLLYDIGLWNLGLRRHGAIVRKEAPVGQFPGGYFTMLAVQLLPLTVTGFARHDAFVIATRVVTLVTVLIVYGLSASQIPESVPTRSQANSGLLKALSG